MKNYDPAVPRDAVGQVIRFGDTVAVIRSGSVTKAHVVGWSKGSLATIAVDDGIHPVEAKHLVRLLAPQRSVQVQTAWDPRSVIAS